MWFQRDMFCKKWMNAICRSKTIQREEFINNEDGIIIPFRSKKHTMGDRVQYRNILNWCREHNIECHQVDLISDYDDKEYDALHIKFNF